MQYIVIMQYSILCIPSNNWQIKLYLHTAGSTFSLCICFWNFVFPCAWFTFFPLLLIVDWWFYLREKKCIKSQEYASEHRLPKLENVLLPKTKGFICCLQELRGSLDAGEFPILRLIILCTYLHAKCVALTSCFTVSGEFFRCLLASAVFMNK